MMTKTEQDLKALVECALDDSMTRHGIVRLMIEESQELKPYWLLREEAEKALDVILAQIVWEARTPAQHNRLDKARDIRSGYR